MRLLSNLFDGLINVLAVLACIMIVLLTFGVALDVIIRALNVGSMPWMLEGSEYMLFGVTFFGAPWVLRAGGHVSVDVFLKMMPHRLARWADIGADIGGVIVSLFLLFYGIKVTLASYEQHVMVYKTLQFPEWWILWVMPAVALCLIGEFGRRLGRSLRRLPAQRPVEGH